MALAIETNTSYTFSAAGDSRSISIAAASNILYVGLALANTANNVTAVTYGAQALAQVTNSPAKNESNVDQIMVWSLLNPPTGSNTMVVTNAASNPTAVAVLSFSGADVGSTPNSTPQTQITDNTTAPTLITVTSSATEIVTDFIAARHLAVNGTIAIGAAQVEKANAATGTATTDIKIGASITSVPGTSLMDWTSTQAMYWAHIAFAVKPAATVPSVPGGSQMLLGVG